ncbi:J domain-containing protein spf31 [Spathaspora sp. JA1]|nr:J domain-containing protein spf31 [Spathaspora sp. JA1]
MNNEDLERILSLEESALNRTTEIERVLKCNQFDYFDILQLNPLNHDDANFASIIKRVYRKKSLLIHPDKTDHPRASDAFDRLKKAEKILSCNNDQEEEFKEKKRLIAIYKSVISGNDINDVAKQVGEILQDEINQQELQVLYQQTAKQWKHEQEQKLKRERELKKQLENKWEDERDVRVKNWRDYSHKVDKKNKKKKSNKPKVLV